MSKLFESSKSETSRFYVANNSFTKELGKQFLAQNGMDLNVCDENRNPPIRFKENAELSIPDASIFYSPCIKGYTDYPFLEKALAM